MNKEKTEKRLSLKEEDNLSSNGEQHKDEPVDFDGFMDQCQTKMDKIYALWNEIKDNDESEEREIIEEFNKAGSKYIDDFGDKIQTKLQNLSELFDKNQNKRKQLNASENVFSGFQLF